MGFVEICFDCGDVKGLNLGECFLRALLVDAFTVPKFKYHGLFDG